MEGKLEALLHCLLMEIFSKKRKRLVFAAAGVTVSIF
jgi:hypothetical protein